MSTAPGPNPLYALTPSQVIAAQSEQWKQIVRQSLADTRCASPAFLTEDLDPVTQTVTVQIAIQERVRTATGPQWWDISPIIKVPVVIPRGGGYSVTLPLKKGDEGLLIFCDTCFDNWWASGQSGVMAQNTPNSGGKTQRQNEVRRHYLHDCGFWPGMYSQPNVLTDYSAGSLQIRTDDGLTAIDVSSTTGVTVVTNTKVTLDATSGTSVDIKAPTVVVDNGGTPLALINDTFYQWYVANIQPFLVSKGYSGPAIPTGSETTVLKGQ
jgi:hypothetical protein